jgi:5-methylcytosine-specific restriction endonuclease McrA
MPAKPPSICRDCAVMVPDGGPYCPAHLENNRQLRETRIRNAARRSGGLKRFYDSSTWRVTVRRFIKARDPLCTIAILCEGRAFTQDIDHIIRAELYIEQHDGDCSYFYDPENLRGACHADHARKTSLENQGIWNEADVKHGR